MRNGWFFFVHFFREFILKIKEIIVCEKINQEDEYAA